ncbi:hypothetical protein KR067_002710 [Drosophila pandora]|nr:hypothetical protein KR067_002710 [Drosophila pandora]
MFRFYKLYSLYVNNMTGGLTWPREWCLCEKLPRAMLHIPVEPRSLRCEVCGLARRPRDLALAASSEEEAAQAASEPRNTAIPSTPSDPSKKLSRGKDVRVKVAVKAQKPKPKSNCPANCVKCGGVSVGGEVTAAPEEDKEKVYSGRHGLYKKPKKKVCRRPLPDRRQKKEPSAPPPSSPSPPPPLSQSESPQEDMPALVAMAHEVFNRPYHLRRRWPSGYRNLLVSDFIPLNSPITDSSGGAISKRSSMRPGNPPSSHSSRPLPPLSKVLANILAKQNTVTAREKGGGLVPPKPRDSLDADSELATQFSPFDEYEGPSEDALVVSSAREMLHRPMSLHIEPRTDLPNNRIGTDGFERRTGYGSTPISSPCKKPLNAKPFSDSMGRSIFESANKISSSTSSSSKNSSMSSDSSTPSILQKSFKFCDVNEEKQDKIPSKKQQNDSSTTFVSIIDKIFWAPKCPDENSDEEFKSLDREQLDELKDMMRSLSLDDHGINSAVNDVSSNKTDTDAEYSKRVSMQEDESSRDRDILGSSTPGTRSRTISVREPRIKSPKCGKCGRHCRNEALLNKVKKQCRIYSNIISNQEVLNSKISRNQNKSSGENCVIKRTLSDPSDSKKSNTKVVCRIHSEGKSHVEIKKSEKNEAASEKRKVKLCKIHHKSSEDTFDDKKDLKFQIQKAKPAKDDQSNPETCQFTKHLCKIIPNKGTGPESINNHSQETEQSRSKNYSQEMTQGTEKILFPKDKSPMDSVPIQTPAIKHMETALHTCWELPPAQTAQYVVREMGVLHITDIPPTKQKTPEPLQPSIYEFRLPDVDPSELELTELTDRNDLELDTDEDETPDAKLRHSQGKKKKKIVPLKYRRREFQYEELEVSFDVTKNTSRIELNENMVQRQSVIQREEILSGVLETSSSQSDTLSSGKSLSLPEYKPIKLLTNVAYESEKSDEQLNHERTTPSNYIEERIQPRDYQEVQNNKGYTNKSAKYNYSDLSRDTRKRIDLSLERKIKRMMNKPIRLLNDGKGNSISEFLSPVTKKFTRSKDSDDDEASNSSSPRRSGGEDDEAESNHGKSYRQYPDYPPTRSLKPDSHMPSQKPLRLIMNQLSSNSSGSKFCSMESVLDIDSDDTSEPIVTQKQTLYEGLPPLNWKLVSLGTTLPKKSDNNEHESAIGEAHTCPIYKCREIITLQSFTSHFDIAHRHRLGAKTIQREHFHRVVEGLPKQFSFDSDHLTAGNSFVALLLYSSLTQKYSKKSIPIRDYPLVLVASLEKLKDSPSGYFFWFVDYPTIVNLQIKLTVYDPDENVGRSRVIMPRDIAEIQDPQCFTSNTRDHLLLRVPPKHRNFQISLEATTEL